MRVLFDTSVISYWLSGSAKFKPSIQKVQADLRKKKAVRLISVITIQELEVWARHGNELEGARNHLSTQFSTPLNFDLACAREAARLASLVQRAPATGKGEKRDIANLWHRDAGIAATAHHHGLDALVTANYKDFAPFAEHMNCELIQVFET